MIRSGSLVRHQDGRQMIVKWFDSAKAMCVYHSGDHVKFEWHLVAELKIIRL